MSDRKFTCSSTMRRDDPGRLAVCWLEAGHPGPHEEYLGEHNHEWVDGMQLDCPRCNQLGYTREKVR